MTSTTNNPTPLSAKISRTVSQYISLLGAGTADDIATLYAPHATLEDPVGTEPRVGHENIRNFYSKIGSGTTAELLTVRISGNTAAFHFRVTTTTADQVIIIEPIDVMTFDEDGFITSMRAIWSPQDVQTTQR